MNLDYHRKSLACLSLLSSLCSFVSSFPFVILHQLPYPKGKKIVCQRYPYLQVAIDFKRKHSWMNLDYHRRSMAWLNSFHLHHISYPKGKKIGYQRYPYSQVTVNFQKKHPHVSIWTTTEGVWLGFLFRPHYAASSLSFPLWISVLPHCFASLLGCLLLCLPKKKFQLFNELFLLHLLVRGRKLLIARGVLEKILLPKQ